MASRDDEQPALGLRERKKVRTHEAIQEHALRLFHEQGYAATTIEQIAEAAEVSPSTFFRYFPTKEDVVMHDSLDPVMIKALEEQPAELSPIQALRATMREVYAGLSAEEMALVREREDLIRSVPELRARMLDDLAKTIDMVAEATAKRVRRPVGDLGVRVFAGAFVGAVIAVWLQMVDRPVADTIEHFDAALAQLEAGLKL